MIFHIKGEKDHEIRLSYIYFSYVLYFKPVGTWILHSSYSMSLQNLYSWVLYEVIVLLA